jgi:hypothetical protein
VVAPNIIDRRTKVWDEKGDDMRVYHLGLASLQSDYKEGTVGTCGIPSAASMP